MRACQGEVRRVLEGSAEQMPLPPVPIADACSALDTKEGREAHGAHELGHGANATVYSFPLGSGSARLASGALVELSSLVVKCGRWRSSTLFEQEARVQRAAAAAGCAPPLHYAAYFPDVGASGASAGAVRGVMAMERLTQPTFYRWLHWVTREQRRKANAANAEAWTISPQALRDSTVRAWEKESQRLLAALIKAGVAHGDWHERNLVFDVPTARDATAVGRAPTPLQHYETKKLIKEAIWAGPAAGKARLLVIDYGGARQLRGRVDRFFARICIDRHLVDPDEEPPSPATRQLTREPSIMRAPSVMSRAAPQGARPAWWGRPFAPRPGPAHPPDSLDSPSDPAS